MHILEPIINADPSLAEQFSGPSRAIVIYRLRTDVLDKLIEFRARMDRATILNPSLFSGRDAISEKEDINLLSAFDADQPEAVIWYDRILAYLAIHDGFLSVGGDAAAVRLDTSYENKVYIYGTGPDHFPRSVKEWTALANAWQIYLLSNWDDEDKPALSDDQPASWYELMATLDIARLELNYLIDPVTLNGRTATIHFNVPGHEGDIVFRADKHVDDPTSVIHYRVDKNNPNYSEEGILTRGRLRNLAFETLVDWHGQAGLAIRNIAVFEERERQIKDLRIEEFHSGLPQQAAEVQALIFPGKKP